MDHRVRLPLIILAACALALASCGKKSEPPTASSSRRSISVSSPAFANGGVLPRRFSCDGQGTPPPLRWSGVPRGTAQFALLMEDPDAPGGTFLHWSLFGIDPATRAYSPGATPAGARAGRNSTGREGYTGPCPPKGDKPHRYVFTVYALGRRLALAAGAAQDEVRKATRTAAIAQGSLTARYGR